MRWLNSARRAAKDGDSGSVELMERQPEEIITGAGP